MQSNTLAPKTARITTPRVGRGGKRGKTSGRGTKGQNARAGHRKRPEMRDILKKLPKLRGHGQNRSHTVRSNRLIYAPVNLTLLEAAFNAGDTVTPETLYKKGLISARGGKIAYVKILGTGSLTKALTVSDCAASGAAKTAIEAAGGSLVS
ncbi:uL15 family ribosomal protein [Patescibacteria group bacterium]|nr:uL15 family ribosomal protein [Patescibacteria group bacterium]MBU1500551.1 uL15 family ribosomal protein [Patescibacteria group bacterium]MBU2080440.1 uL15 family ribosomal protein [Patescibacteria group bacterium]MBU2123755.1 uL15 family ribosomal protein [Patescibacteria group bacterium]MBU2194611.1 uL15 family ribosomal protein [Patescibacteria group bacterium]